MIVAVIGGGASGMAAAISAAEQPGAQVILLERQGRVGRKLQATGNGRCNLSNLHASQPHYHGDDPTFVNNALARYTPVETLNWFRELGLYTVTEVSGKIYPYSDQANSVVDVLRFALERENLQLVTGYEVQKIRRNCTGFLVDGTGDPVFCDRLIVACGGLAGGKLGGSMAGYKLLRSFGHHVTKLRPSLVQIKCGWDGIGALKGVRANCHVVMTRDDVTVAESTGELQLTENGLSGPVIFEISRDICQGAGFWSARLDFLPDLNETALQTELAQRRATKLPAEELLTGILHNRLGRVLTRAAGIRGNRMIAELTDRELVAGCSAVKGFEIPLTEPLGMDSAQVTAGGVLTSEFDSQTMESRLVPGLYACGEVLDIDGDCGGYNLQWAWSSGRLAGRCAGEVTP